MQLKNLQGYDGTTQSVYEHVVDKPDLMDTSITMPDIEVVKGELSTIYPTETIKKQLLLEQLRGLNKLDGSAISTDICNSYANKLNELVNNIKSIQHVSHTPSIGLEERLKVLEDKIGIQHSDVLFKLHAIQQAAQFIQHNEKLLANPQMADLTKAQALSQLYTKYSPIKDNLPKLMDQLTIIKEGQLLTQLNTSIQVTNTIQELKQHLDFLKSTSQTLESTVLDNQKLILSLLNK